MSKWGDVRRAAAGLAPPLLLILSCVAMTARAQSDSAARYWVGKSGDWGDASNWSLAPDDPFGGGAGMPTGGDANVVTSDSVNRDILIRPPDGATWNVGSFVGDSLGTGNTNFRLSSGTFDVSHFSVGENGHATFFQTGGTLRTGQLLLSLGETGRGTYELSGGTILAESADMAVGNRAALFRQRGGAFVAGRDVTFGGNGSRAEISAGTLRTPNLQVGSGATFTQTGGAVDADALTLDSTFEWKAGTLRVRHRLDLEFNARLTLPAKPTTLSIDGPVIVKPDVQFANAKKLTLNLGPHALMIREPYFDPKAVFAKYANAGIEYVKPKWPDGPGPIFGPPPPLPPLVIPAGRTIYGYGGMDLPLSVRGTLMAPPDAPEGSFYVAARFQVNPGGRLSASTVVAAGESSVAGGRLEADEVAVIGGGLILYPQTGPSRPVMTQQGGTVEARVLTVGSAFGGGDYGTYRQVGGRLEVNVERIGDSRALPPASGRFEQRGGTHLVTGSVVIGGGEHGDGQMTLAGGELRAADLAVSAPGVAFVNTVPKYGLGRLAITGASARLLVSGSLTFGARAQYAAVPGTTVRLTGGSLFLDRTDPALVPGFANTSLIFTGTGAATGPGYPSVDENGSRFLEVAGADRGADASAYLTNFVLGALQVGDGADAGAVVLRDDRDNQPGSSEAEALYVRHLVVTAGSTLDLNGLHLYALDADVHGQILRGEVNLVGASPAPAPNGSGAAPIPLTVPEPAAWGSLAIVSLGSLLCRGRRRSTVR